MGKFCTSCGTALNEGAKFCAKGGANSIRHTVAGGRNPAYDYGERQYSRA